MKTGKASIIDLAKEVDAQSARKRDMVVDTRALELSESGKTLIVNDGKKEVWNGMLTEHAHDQIAGRLDIPRKYYDTMRTEAPHLLKTNVEHWLRANPRRLMVRGMEPLTAESGRIARAVMTDRYARIDNNDVLRSILPVLKEVPSLRVESCEVTEKRLYVKCVTERKTLEVKKGDAVQAGVMITNSEIGLGAVTISPLLFRLVCLNGLVLNDSRFRQHHVGARADKTDALYSMLSDETRAADDRAILLKSRDIVKAALSEAFLSEKVEKLREASEDRISDKANPVKVVEVLSNRIGLNEMEGGSVLQELIKGGDLSRWGVVNAVTRAAQGVESYDRSTMMEMMGGTILDLPTSEWRAIATAH